MAILTSSSPSFYIPQSVLNNFFNLFRTQDFDIVVPQPPPSDFDVVLFVVLTVSSSPRFNILTCSGKSIKSSFKSSKYWSSRFSVTSSSSVFCASSLSTSRSLVSISFSTTSLQSPASPFKTGRSSNQSRLISNTPSLSLTGCPALFATRVLYSASPFNIGLFLVQSHLEFAARSLHRPCVPPSLLYLLGGF